MFNRSVSSIDVLKIDPAFESPLVSGLGSIRQSDMATMPVVAW